MSSFFALWRKYVIYYEAKVKGAQQWMNQSVWRYQKVLSDKDIAKTALLAKGFREA
jgi:hypothetical protein